MPYCEVGKYQNGVEGANNNGIKIFYRTYGRGPIKVLMIIGLAGTHESWGPQIQGLIGTLTPNDQNWPEGDRSSSEDDGDFEGQIEVCALDNRGMGRSSVPIKKSEYTTTIMAKDAIAVMDHLGWDQAHVFGHSMGAMISCKLAAMVPDRVLSLALLNVTGGGFECLPKLDRRTISIAIRFLRAKTPEQRAAVDLDTHYTKEYLEELVGTETRRVILYQEYVKGISATGMQSNYGFDGQINACWTHKMSEMEFELMRSSGFFISVIHGRDDVIAQLRHARRLAGRLYPYAKMVELPGGHLVSHERTKEHGIYRSSDEAGPSNAVDILSTNPSWHEHEEDKKKPSDDSELSKIEQIMKGKLFSRDEINRLTEILNSKIVSDDELEKEQPKLTAEGEAKMNTLAVEYHKTPIENEKYVNENVPNVASPHAESNIQNKVNASPIDIAKAYMGSRTSELGPSSYSTMSKSERTLYKSDDVQTNLFIPPPSPKPSTCWPGAMVQDQHFYSTPVSQRGSFGFQNLPRTPYSRTIYSKSKSKLSQSQADNRCLNVSSSPFQHSRTPIFGQVKSRTNLDNGYGSGGAIRRIRNKFATETPGRGFASPFSLHKGPSEVKESNASKVFFPKEKNMELVGTSGTADDHLVESVAYGSSEGLLTPTLQSSPAAREILEELANKPTPNDLATELKIVSPWKNFPSRDSDIIQNEHTSSAHSRGSVDMRKGTNDLKVSAEGSVNGENLVNREKSLESDALNVIAKKSSKINGESDVTKFTRGQPSVAINKVSEFQMRSTHENAFMDANKRQNQDTEFGPVDNHVNQQDIQRMAKITGSELLKKQTTSFSGTKRTLKSISVNKQGVPGFTFPVSASASGTLSEPPTPSITPSFSSVGMPQRTEESSLPSYTFGAKGSFPRLDFSSFPSTSKSATPNDASDMKFNFGSDNKTRISFKLVGEGANCY